MGRVRGARGGEQMEEAGHQRHGSSSWNECNMLTHGARTPFRGDVGCATSGLGAVHRWLPHLSAP
eukprot:9831029-Alexandrium_andersonii.AAC.1